MLFVTALMLYSCSKNNNAPANSSGVMFVNGCAGTNVDMKADGKLVQGATGIGFQKTSGYRYLTAGSAVNIAFYLVDGTPLVSSAVNMTASKNYSIFTGGLVTSPTFLLVSDDLSSPTSSSNAKIRIVNLSHDSLNITAYAGTNSFASGVGINSASAFSQVQAGLYELKAGDPANISTVISAGNQMLSAGKIYTLLYTGSQSGSGLSALKISLVNNN